MEHIVKSYDVDLKYLHSMIGQMGAEAISQLEKALRVVQEKNKDLAEEVIAHDPHVDQLEATLDTFAIRMLALRQPMALDLRTVVAALKISSHLERMADYAANIAKRGVAIMDTPQVPPLPGVLPQMVSTVIQMMKDVLKAFAEQNDEEAQRVWRQDAEVDALYTSLLRELLTYMMEDPRNIGSCTHLLFMGKNIERIGDHVTNIAEAVHFMLYGVPFAEPRLKSGSEQ